LTAYNSNFKLNRKIATYSSDVFKIYTGILRSDLELSGITWHTKLTSYLETKHYFLVEQAFFGRNGTICLKIYKENFDVSSEGPSSGVASIGRQVDMWIVNLRNTTGRRTVHWQRRALYLRQRPITFCLLSITLYALHKVELILFQILVPRR
jgi:hypothetical protein